MLFQLSLENELMINSIHGGGLRNAIPRESVAIISISENNISKFQDSLDKIKAEIIAEHKTTDPGIDIDLHKVDKEAKALEPSFQKQLLRSIYACPNGIYRMSPDIDGLVQTSNNLAKVTIENGAYQFLCLTRSSIDSEKLDLANAIGSSFALIGSAIAFSGSYPGWTPKPSAPIIKLMADLYRARFNEEPKVNACHAGLECGILGTNYPSMDMISFGPNIRGAHSPDERVQVSSVQKYWGYLLEVLQNIPNR